MKKVIGVVLVGAILLGCATVKINAPAGESVTLISETETTTFKTTKRVWYVLWGLVPITNNSTDEMIKQYNLKKVRVTTQFDIVDYLIAFFLGGLTIQTKTVIIEGSTE